MLVWNARLNSRFKAKLEFILKLKFNCKNYKKCKKFTGVILDRCALSTVAISYAFEKLGKYPTFKHAMRSI